MKESHELFFEGGLSETATRHICLNLINWILVTWLHIDVREVRKCHLYFIGSLFFIEGGNNKYWGTVNSQQHQQSILGSQSGECLILFGAELEGFQGEKTLLFCL